MDERLRELRDLLRGQEYPHRDEFEEAVAGSGCRIDIDGTEQRTRVPLPAEHYLGIYKMRHRHLTQFHTPHAETLANDVAWLCKNLELDPLAPVELWGV